MNSISLATGVGVVGILFANLSFASQTDLNRQLDRPMFETILLLEANSAIKFSSDFLQIAAKPIERGVDSQTTARQKQSIERCKEMHKEMSHEWGSPTDDQWPWDKLDGP